MNSVGIGNAPTVSVELLYTRKLLKEGINHENIVFNKENSEGEEDMVAGDEIGDSELGKEGKNDKIKGNIVEASYPIQGKGGRMGGIMENELPNGLEDRRPDYIGPVVIGLEEENGNRPTEEGTSQKGVELGEAPKV